jgi:flagellar basal body rod protein FlgG
VSTGLYSSVAALQAGERRLEAITTNLANVSTPAFKRRASGASAFVVDPRDPQHVQVETHERVDFRQGVLERTGNALDLALMGEGFFVAEGARGEVYTRNGSLRLDPRGVLQTAEGRPLVWSRPGGPIDPLGEPVRIDEQGNVFQGSEQVGQLKLVAFESAEQLEVDGQGYYHARPGIEPVPADAEMHQFALEGSNVSAVDELVALISVQRSFQSASQLMRLIDETYQRLNGNR